MLRQDELFVIESVAQAFQGKWREGENPPDAYLALKGGEVAVEITTLVQPATSDSGKFTSRMSQDATAIGLANRLDQRLRSAFPGTRAAFLILTAPIKNVRKLEASLEAKLIDLAAKHQLPTEPVDFLDQGNDVLINFHEEWEPGHKRVAGSVINSRATADILPNAISTLNERLVRKASWSRARKDAWLALLNLYGLLADLDTYKQALPHVSTDHNFKRILLVSTGGKVEVLFDRQ